MPLKKPLPTVEEILRRFYQLNATIRLSKSRFGYISVGRPDIITRLEEGHKVRPRSLARLAETLDDIEKGHSTPVKAPTI